MNLFEQYGIKAIIWEDHGDYSTITYDNGTYTWTYPKYITEIAKMTAKNEVDENLTYKEFNEDEFYDDLASAKAVVCNGGFTFISEAITLKKPIYSVPAIGNFEQTLNGFYVQKLGYGEYHEKLNAKKVDNFLKRLPRYQKRLEKVKKTNNDGVVRELIYRIEKYSR